MIQWPDTFVEHLSGAPGPANEELFFHLVSTLPPRRQQAVMLHFHDCLIYRVVGEHMGGITANRATQLAERGVRDIRTRIAADTGMVALFEDAERGPALRAIISSSLEEYQSLIDDRKRRLREKAARCLAEHSADDISSLIFPSFTYRALTKAGIKTVGQLAAMTKEDLMKIRGANIVTIESRLHGLGINLPE